jgi:Flp pilus assembly protein TadD
LEAIRINPQDSSAYNDLAWLMATCCEAKHRDGNRAVEVARHACELSAWNDPNCFATLAAAYAEVGSFEEAVKWHKKALESPTYARERGEQVLRRLQLYEQGKPYRVEDYNIEP